MTLGILAVDHLAIHFTESCDDREIEERRGLSLSKPTPPPRPQPLQRSQLWNRHSDLNYEHNSGTPSVKRCAHFAINIEKNQWKFL